MMFSAYRTMNYINRHIKGFIPTFLSMIVAGFIGWYIGWIMPSKPVEVSNIPKHELTCTLNYSQQMISQNSPDSHLKILYDESEVTNPYIFSFTIKNTGSYAVTNDDFKDDFTISLEKCDRIVAVSVIETSNQEIWDEIIASSQYYETEFSISDFFLNPGEHFTIHIITSGKPSNIHYHARIKNISELMLRDTNAETIKNLQHRQHTAFIIMCCIFGAILLSVVFMLIVTARDTKKLKTEFKAHQGPGEEV